MLDENRLRITMRDVNSALAGSGALLVQYCTSTGAGYRVLYCSYSSRFLLLLLLLLPVLLLLL